jgi:hypothetical protein
MKVLPFYTEKPRKLKTYRDIEGYGVTVYESYEAPKNTVGIFLFKPTELQVDMAVGDAFAKGFESVFIYHKVE